MVTPNDRTGDVEVARGRPSPAHDRGPSARPDGSPDTSSGRFVHEAFLYQSDDEVLDVLVPFLREALERGDAAVVDLDDRKANLLRRELGRHAHDVTFIGGRWYTNPASAIREYVRLFESLVADDDGRSIRFVGELPGTATNGSWPSWRRYESAINVAFDELPVWSICLFDRSTLPSGVLTDVLCTHPQLTTPSGPHTANELYTHPREWLTRLSPRPHCEVERTAPHVELVDPAPHAARAAIAALADGLSDSDRDGLLVGVSEVVSNAILHGEGPATLRAWAGDGYVVATVDDRGTGVADPLVGLVPQRREIGAGGLGLWLTHQLCDDVALMQHRDGFRVRLVAGDACKHASLSH